MCVVNAGVDYTDRDAAAIPREAAALAPNDGCSGGGNAGIKSYLVQRYGINP